VRTFGSPGGVQALPWRGTQVEIPVPEQFLTVVKGGKLVTETVNHSGG
jgi:hypothetical protein